MIVGGAESQIRLCCARLGRLAGVAIAMLGVACGDSGGHRYQTRSSALVYDADDRQEYYEVTSLSLRDIAARGTVALVQRSQLSVQDGRIAILAPPWTEAANLCADERFGDQPALAFCSGILVDWDLVLTAAHCARAFPVGEFAVLFGYYYSSPNALASATASDLVPVAEVLAERLDGQEQPDRLDFAWLRLARPVENRWSPAAIHVAPPGLQIGQGVLTVGFGGGVPAKWDFGGSVRDTRAQVGDYFVTDSDTFKGSSGSPAFDSTGSVLGVMARGGPDLFTTDAGCMSTVVWPTGTGVAQEDFTYANRALAGLCGQLPDASALCRRDCTDPCIAGPRPLVSDIGCSVSGRSFQKRYPSYTFMLISGLLLWRWRRCIR